MVLKKTPHAVQMVKKNAYLPQGSETSQIECSLCVGEDVHLLGFGELFPALASSIADKDNISLNSVNI